jgi:hypothetical protein
MEDGFANLVFWILAAIFLALAGLVWWLTSGIFY